MKTASPTITSTALYDCRTIEWTLIRLWTDSSPFMHWVQKLFFSPFSVSVDLTNTRPTNSGDITLKCPGLYHIEASITKDGSDPGAGFNELALQHYDKNKSFVGTLAFAQRKLMANLESLTVEGNIRADPSEAGAKITVVVRGTGTVRGWNTTVTPQVYDVTAEPASYVEITFLGP